MIDYDSFSRCHLTDIFFRFSRGAKELIDQPLADPFRKLLFAPLHEGHSSLIN